MPIKWYADQEKQSQNQQPDQMSMTPPVAPSSSTTSGIAPPGLPSVTPAQDTSPKGFKESHPWVSAAFEAAKSVVTQPAEAMQRVGTGIGEYAASKVKLPFEKEIASSLGFTKENAPQVRSELEKGVAPSPSVESAAGSLTQAAANLATPFAITPQRMALQSAVLGAGKAMEEEKGLVDIGKEAVTSGALGYGLGKLGSVAGSALQKGKGLAITAKDELVQSLKPVVKKLAPYLTGIPKKEITQAVEMYPEMVKRNLETIKGISNPADAESSLRKNLLTGVRSVYEKANEVAQTAFDKGYTAVKSKFPNVSGDKQGVLGAVQHVLKESGGYVEKTLKKVGRGYKEDFVVHAPVKEDRELLQDLYNTVKQHDDFSLDGLRRLNNEIWSYVDAAEPGSDAARKAYLVWDTSRKEMSRITNGEIDSIFSPYAEFKKNAQQIAQATKPTAREDSARNFVANLESAAKTGSRDALKKLEELAGMEGAATGEITAYRLAKKLALEHRITGSRAADILISFSLPGIGSTVGEVVGGEKGKQYGSLIGTLAGAKMLSPELVSKVLFAEAEKAGTKIVPTLNKKLGQLLSNPATLQILRKTIEQLSADEKEKADQEALKGSMPSPLEEYEGIPNDAVNVEYEGF